MSEDPYSLFSKGNYAAAMEQLLVLKSKNPNDVRVDHNILVCQYFMDGRKNGMKFVENLRGLKGIESANRSSNNDEDDGEDEDEDEDDITEESSRKSKKRVGLEKLRLYNVAVILKESRYTERAFEIACEVFEMAMAEAPFWFAVKSGLLVAELGVQLGREQGSISPTTWNKVNSALDWMETRIQASKKEPSNDLNTQPPGTKQTLQPRAIKTIIHIYRAKVSLLQGAKATAKREVKAAHDLVEHGSQNQQEQMRQQVIGLQILRAQLQFVLCDYHSALELLGGVASLIDGEKNSSGDEMVAATIYYNNLGTVNHKMKKLQAAMFYFTKALMHDEKGSSSRSYHSHRYYDLMYNLGVCGLGVGQFSVAGDCFLEASNCPRFPYWRYAMRMGETAIASHVAVLKAERRKFKGNLGIESGAPDRSRLILPSSYTGQNVQKHDVIQALKQALEVLLNARSLLSTSPDKVKETSSLETPNDEYCVRNPPLQWDLIALVTCLLEISYIGLVLEDAPTAVSATTQLFNLFAKDEENALHQDYLLLAKVYGAEAHAMLNNLSAATDLLKLHLPSSGDNEGFLAKGAGGMKLVLFTDLITCLIFAKDFDAAQQILNSALVMTTNPSPDLFLLQGYLSLRRMDYATALNLLKRGRPLPKRATKNK